MSEAIKLKNWGRYGEGNAEYKGCELYFSEDRSELRIEKGDANPEVWRVGEFDKASGKAHYTNDLLGDDGITGDWSDEDWEQVDEHASRYHIASNRELWREYFDPDENYTDKDWEDEPVKDRVKTMEEDATTITDLVKEAADDWNELTPEQEKEARRWLDKYGGDDGLEKLKEDNPELDEFKGPQNNYEALVYALWLSLTAPEEDEKYDECIAMAEEVASRLTEEEVERAKEEAKRHVRWHS